MSTENVNDPEDSTSWLSLERMIRLLRHLSNLEKKLKTPVDQESMIIQASDE